MSDKIKHALVLLFPCCFRSRGIKSRKEDAVMGLCSQIGNMYNVHHIWRYKDLAARKNERDRAWKSGLWADCVVRTGLFNCGYMVEQLASF